MSAPRVSVVVVSFEARDDLSACLASIDSHGGPGIQTIVVDNASTDGSADVAARAKPDARLIRNAENAGFGRACNQGAAASSAPGVRRASGLRKRRDDALMRVLDEDAHVGIVGPRTVNDDGTPQLSFGPALGLLAEWRQRRLVRGVRRRDPATLRRVEALTAAAADPDWVSGSCLLVRRRTFEQVGGFDEAFFLYEEDVDLCVRARAAGWSVRFEPRAVVRHALGRSMARHPERARLEYHRSHLRYYQKHNGAPATAALRAGIAAKSLAGWMGALLKRDAALQSAHADAIRLALGRSP